MQDVNKKINPIPEEKGLQELLDKHVGESLNAVNSIEKASDCDIYIVIVPLFIDENKQPDYSILKNAFEELTSVLKDDDLVVLETTVPPGTCEGMLKPILDKSGKNYFLAHSPERIMTGKSISRYKEFPKVVGGIDKESGKRAYEFYSKFCSQVNLVSDAKTAELIKVSEGVYRDVNIALANELYKLSEKLGVNYYEVRENANHAFCNLHLPGNVGGHCIPVYPWFLINEFDVPLIKNAREINDDMIKYYADKLPEGKKIAVVGITYRSGVKETAYSRAFPMIALLKERGYDVYVNDPLYSEKEIEELGFKHTDSFEEMDGIILMNAYEEYKEKLAGMKEKVVDVPGILD